MSMASFDKFKVGNVPTVIYVPNFITVDKESFLLNNINSAPLPKWKSLKNRRLQHWGGVVHEKVLLQQPLPTWLLKITDKIYQESGMFPDAINHVLINEYLPNQGIMAHQDGPAYFPVVAILSLASPVVMDFMPHSRLTNPLLPFSLLLMPRSLLIFKDAAYSDFLHGIKDTEVQSVNGVANEVEAQQLNVEQSGDAQTIHRTTTRVSLTCRLVSKVHKNLFKF